MDITITTQRIIILFFLITIKRRRKNLMKIKNIISLCMLIALSGMQSWPAAHNPATDYSKDQPTRLRITNLCPFPIWIGHLNISDAQNIKLDTDQSHDYNIPKKRTDATRFWPKIGCDENGDNCVLGQSMDPCPEDGCHPPIESKFEATWAATSCSHEKPDAECLTWYNSSLVDGYTIPFNVIPKGPDAGKNKCVAIDSANLDLNQCPVDEDLSGGNPAYKKFSKVDLRVYDPSDSNKIIGCMAPCKKLNYSKPWGFGFDETHDPTLHMCCPTDPVKLRNNTCTWANGCATPQSCKNTHDPLCVKHTKYVQRLDAMAPNQYNFSYDDDKALQQCTARTKFEIVFCPLGSANNTYQAEPPMPVSPTKPTKPKLPKKPEAKKTTPSKPVVVEGLCSDGQTKCAGCQCCPDGTLCPSAQNCPPKLCPNDEK